MYVKAATPIGWIPKLIDYGNEIDITVFSSVFDPIDVKKLVNSGMPAFKIASNELTDWPLLEAVIKTQLPIIMSTGTTTKLDLTQTIEFIKDLGAIDRLVILHCVSAYPASVKDSNLITMGYRQKPKCYHRSFRSFFGHNSGYCCPALGAAAIEKHITLDRNDGGRIHLFHLSLKNFFNYAMRFVQHGKVWEVLNMEARVI